MSRVPSKRTRQWKNFKWQVWCWARREYRNQYLSSKKCHWHSVQTQTATITGNDGPDIQVPIKRFLYTSLKLFSDIQCVWKNYRVHIFLKNHISNITFTILRPVFQKSQKRTCRTVHFLCKNWKKNLEGKTANISRWASPPCFCYLFMSAVHCMVYCWYKDDNFTDLIIRHIATKRELCYKFKAVSLYIVQYM